jgi:hypothetical protein
MVELEQGHHDFIDWVVSDEAVVNTGMVHRYDEEVGDVYYWNSEEGVWTEGISPDMQYLILEMGGEVPEFNEDPEENLDHVFYEAMIGRLALILFFITYAVALITWVVIIIRNSFIHLLMLENGTNHPRDAAKDSIQLVKQPRRKHVDLLAWLFVTAAMAVILAFVVALISPSPYEPSSTTTSATEIVNAILTYLAAASIFAIHDVGLAKQFWAARGMLRTANPGPKFSFSTVLAIVVSIGVFVAVGIGLDQIQTRQREEYYENFQNTRSPSVDDTFYTPSSSQPEFNYEDWDNNGVLDDEQCPADSVAFPTFVEYNQTTGRSTYEIECL